MNRSHGGGIAKVLASLACLGELNQKFPFHLFYPKNPASKRRLLTTAPARAARRTKVYTAARTAGGALVNANRGTDTRTRGLGRGIFWNNKGSNDRGRVSHFFYKIPTVYLSRLFFFFHDKLLDKKLLTKSLCFYFFDDRLRHAHLH